MIRLWAESRRLVCVFQIWIFLPCVASILELAIWRSFQWCE
jgi:hypothetical protein